MKKILFLAFLPFFFTIISGCQHSVNQDQAIAGKKVIFETGNFGLKVSPEGALEANELSGLFLDTDSVDAKVKGFIASSCKHSGCWMDIDLGNSQTVHVTFKDDAFTIPLTAAGKNAVVQGVAYREMIPVETLKNFAREDGKSEEEIAAIVDPAWKYNFIATGVIIEDKE